MQMESIKVPGSDNNPQIDFDFHKGIFKISGRLVSVASSEHKFFVPLLEKISEYSKSPCPETKVFIDLEYCSSAGIKNMFQLLKMFDHLHLDGKNVEVEWRFFIDDEDGKDKGMYFKKLLNLPIKVVMYSND
jgi:hypothetical protein